MFPKLLQKLLILLLLFLCIILLLYKNVILRGILQSYIVRLGSIKPKNFTNNSNGYAPAVEYINLTVIQPITIMNEAADRESNNTADVSNTEAKQDGSTYLQQHQLRQQPNSSVESNADVTIVINTKNNVQLSKKLIESIRMMYAYPIIIVDDGKLNQAKDYTGKYHCEKYLKLPYESGVFKSRMDSLVFVKTRFIFMCSDEFKFTSKLKLLKLKHEIQHQKQDISVAVKTNVTDLNLLNGFMAKKSFLGHLWHVNSKVVDVESKTLSERVTFFMYEDTNITMNNWTRICARWNTADIQMLQKLKNHRWRTSDHKKAMFFIIPTPIYQSFMCNTGHIQRQNTALESLVSHPYFNGGDRHIMMAHHWRFSVWSQTEGLLSDYWWQQLENVTLSRYEYYGMSKWENSYRYYPRKPEGLFSMQWEQTKYSIVVPYGDMNTASSITIPVFTEWKQRINLIWYHTTPGSSANGGTILRHLPLKSNLSGNIGYKLPKREWLQGWSESKFCLVISGDTPTSHSFYHSIASGCIPVIISDMFYVGAPFEIDYEKFCIVIKQSDFIAKPQIDTMLQSLSDDVIKLKLDALREVQPKLLYRHPNSTVADQFLRQLYKDYYRRMEDSK